VRQNETVNAARSYGLQPAVKSMATSVGGGSSSERVEVWLRGNVRPVAVVAAVGAAILAGGVALAVAVPLPPAARGAVVGLLALAAAGLVLLVYATSRPRLVRCGDRLRVRVAPLAVADVPLEVVECFFAGSTPLDATGAPAADEQAAYRVGTLVVRVAERAVAHHRRDTLRPWVVWEEGSIVIDGRWCEPLSPAKARDLGGRLVAAKRGIADGSAGG
jgi:hypothetical protein